MNRVLIIRLENAGLLLDVAFVDVTPRSVDESIECEADFVANRHSEHSRSARRS